MLYRVRGAIIIGILLVSIISWPRPTSVTYFPHTPVGDSNFDFFKSRSMPFVHTYQLAAIAKISKNPMNKNDSKLLAETRSELKIIVLTN